jgi:hypothetical protein
MVWEPTLYLNNQQPDAGNNYNEIGVSVSDYRLVVDNYFVRQLLEKRKHLPLAGTRAAGKAIWYHFSHAASL